MRSGDGEVCDFPRQPAGGVWFVHPRVFNSHWSIFLLDVLSDPHRPVLQLVRIPT